MTASPDATPSAASPVAFLFAAWFVALSASLAVLFIGEVLGQTPCNLCWFQRAFMFPLAIILGVAAWRADLSIWRYAAPLAVLGGAVALYHSLLYAGIVPAPIVPCTASGPSCTDADPWPANPSALPADVRGNPCPSHSTSTSARS